MANPDHKGPIVNGATLRHKRRKELNNRTLYAFNNKGLQCPACKKCDYIKGLNTSNEEKFLCKNCGYWSIIFPDGKQEGKTPNPRTSFEEMIRADWIILNNSAGCCIDCSWRKVLLSWRKVLLGAKEPTAECINDNCDNYKVDING